MRKLLLLTVSLLLLAAKPALAQISTPDEDEMKFALSVFALNLESLQKGDLTDRSAKFPSNQSGALLKDLYGNFRATFKITFDSEDNVIKHKYYELLGGELYSSPSAALRELKALVPICIQARSDLYIQYDQLKRFTVDQEGDTSAIKQFRGGMRNTYDQARSHKYSSMNYWQQRLILVSQMQDLYQFLASHRGQYKDLDGWVVFTKGPASLDAEFKRLRGEVVKTATVIADIMNKAPGAGAAGRIRDAVGSSSG